jgi:uncharacterized protein DUF6459
MPEHTMMPGVLRPPTPQAATPTRGHEPPDPHDPGIGPAQSPPPKPAPHHPAMLGDLLPPAPGEQGCPNGPGGRRPLPDPMAVRLCRIPDPAPPYDTEVSHGTRPKLLGSSAPANQGGASRPADPPVPAPGAFPGWPSRFAQVLAETLAGSRPPGQIVPWTTEMARLRIEHLGRQLASGQQPRVRRVVTYHPTSDVMEMTVVVGFGSRVRALAVRLERTGSRPQAGPQRRNGSRQPEMPRWLCTAIEAA